MARDGATAVAQRRRSLLASVPLYANRLRLLHLDRLRRLHGSSSAAGGGDRGPLHLDEAPDAGAAHLVGLTQGVASAIKKGASGSNDGHGERLLSGWAAVWAGGGQV